MEEIFKRPEYKKISDDIDAFVKEKIDAYSSDGIDAKTIHDPIWGSTEYSEWEMKLIDSPLLQRLRNISQVGLAVLTYPSARHSRFEHSLGVAAAAKKLINRINSNELSKIKINDSVRDKIVLAALVHDVGHCFYSHLSESIYGEIADFVELKKAFKNIYDVKPKAHEILSFLIINSPSFKKFFKEQINYPNLSNVDALLEDVGKIIVGINIKKDGNIESYQTSIINGTFDVDKLDYIKRDSYTAGLSLDYDIERLFTKIIIRPLTLQNGKIEYRLVIQANGVTAIEELTFCKIMLFSYIYYHQKVLVTEAIIKDYAQALLKLNVINSFADFLRYDETIILNLCEKQKNQKPFPDFGEVSLQELAQNIRNRNLPKRCLEISQSIVQRISDSDDHLKECEELLEKIKSNEKYTAQDLNEEINKLIPKYTSSKGNYIANYVAKYRNKTYEELLSVRKSIYDKLIGIYKQNGKAVNFSTFDIYFVFPPAVSYGSSSEKIVFGRNNDLMTINDYVKLEQWASSFNAYKWRGYVFVSQKIDKELALEACQQVIFNGEVSIDSLKAFLKVK